ncbi:MAG: peptidase E [Candidatus Latescibacteria bacterium]|jgi:dipeptidase E|nr:peptidase E [Candidatus Latescibacterota bacterium]
MGKIVAIGGGSNLPRIDREIIRLAKKKRPRALLIPTATYDRPDVYDAFQERFGAGYGCSADVLYLLKNPPSLRVIREKILTSDIIYVSGGNSLKMMRRWRRLGVDRVLEKAYQEQKVLCGASAGAICWAAFGHSDSMSFYNSEKWDYVRVKALGLFPLLLCPHLDGENRGTSFCEMIARHDDMGIGLDNFAALEIVDGTFRILSENVTASGYKVYRKGNAVVTETLDKGTRFKPLRLLMERNGHA